MVHYGGVGFPLAESKWLSKGILLSEERYYGLSNVVGRLVGVDSFELDFEVEHFVTTKEQHGYQNLTFRFPIRGFNEGPHEVPLSSSSHWIWATLELILLEVWAKNHFAR